MVDKQDKKQEIIPTGLYRHYKGGEYEVIGQGLSIKDQQELVIYIEPDSGKMWARSKEDFLAEVKRDGKSEPRFIMISGTESFSWEDKYKRALADYQNLVKQQAKEKVEFVRYAVSDFLSDLIPVYDHLKLSLSGISKEEEGSPWAQGVRHVLKQFKDLLANRGVEEIVTVGKRFDHDTMEAVDGAGQEVIQEVMPGYKLNGRLIRPAKVIVAEEKMGEEKNNNDN